MLGLPLHRFREFGVTIREMDLLDEKPLTLDHMRVVCSSMLGIGAELPHPEVDWMAFVHRLEVSLHSTPKTWCPVKRTQRPWIDISKLQSTYHPSLCVLM